MKNEKALLDELEALIEQYAENKQEAESYDKLAKEENSRIKDVMARLGLTETTAHGYKVLVSRVSHESLNEAKLLSVLRAQYPEGTELIKTREYVDMDLLEKMLYKGEISDATVALLDLCKESKPDTFTLRVTKLKEGGRKKV